MPRLAYPAVARGDDADSLHEGRVVARDPYRALDDPEAAATKEFVAAQQAVTASYFSGDERVAALRGQLRTRLESLYSYERVGCPMVRGSRTFAFRNSGLQNQDVMLQLSGDAATAGAGADAGADADAGMLAGATPFLDLNARFPDGTTALSTSAFSEDGAYFAYALSHGGSDWVTIAVRDVATGADLPDDVIPHVKFSGITWLRDGSGFFYSRYPAPAIVDAEGSHVLTPGLYRVQVGGDAASGVHMALHKVSAEPVPHLQGSLEVDQRPRVQSPKGCDAQRLSEQVKGNPV